VEIRHKNFVIFPNGRRRMRIAAGRIGWLGVALLVSAGCGDAATDPSLEATENIRARVSEQAAPEGPRQLESFDSDFWLDKEWKGDLDGMVERGVVRALVAYSLGQYFLDGAAQRGATYEALTEFEKFLNQRLGRRTLKVPVVIIPVQRDELFPALERGLGDIAAANLTVTGSRLEKVDFSNPFMTGVSELVVTGSGGPALRSLDDLAGREIHVRRSSSYWRSLEKLNNDLRSRGLRPVEVIPAEEFLQDEDLLEMVNAGLLPATVVDSHKARFWAQFFPEARVHEDLAVRTGGEIAWAFRKECPQLAAVVNDFVVKHKKGTLLGNVVLNRYLKDASWARNALADEDRSRLAGMLHLFEKYGEKYDFDPLMLAALAYQESGLEQSLRSRAGAVGVMQLLPSTAADPNVGIPEITDLENNIHAGTKYLRFIRDRYFSDPGMDTLNQEFFTFAAYNAGPARVRGLREEAARSGFDANQWFGNVEHVAAKKIGRETVQYVSNIAKYWVAYTLVSRHIERRRKAGS
jgi:membrane-bound lytic murein transglycosylase MltF